MKFSRESKYGLEALLHLVEQSPGRVLTALRIAKASGVPPSFLAKIFQKLAQHGIVRSFRGATRGYALARPANEINLRDILSAVEGPGLFERCVFWDASCGEEHPCLLHDGWKRVKSEIVGFLEQTTLDDIARSRAVSARGAGPSAPAPSR